MDDVAYLDILEKALFKLGKLIDERDRMELEIGKLQQFLTATHNLLSDDAQKKFESKWQPVADKLNILGKSLKEAVLRALLSASPDWQSSTDVRDRLQAMGFDFSSYSSSPLASVSTTLRRLKEANEVQFKNLEGIGLYRVQPRPTSLQPPVAPASRK
jgi:hypothetical protein